MRSQLVGVLSPVKQRCGNRDKGHRDKGHREYRQVSQERETFTHQKKRKTEGLLASQNPQNGPFLTIIMGEVIKVTEIEA